MVEVFRHMKWWRHAGWSWVGSRQRKSFTRFHFQSKGKLLILKWVDTRKCSGVVRSRLVVREVKKSKKIVDQLEPQDVGSAMPPVESLKAVVNHVITQQKDVDSNDLVFGVFHVSRAHVKAEAERDLHANLPEEMAEDGDGCCTRLNRTMLGTQEAVRLWSELWAKDLEKQRDYEIGKSSRALFYSRKAEGVCHWDDFVGIVAAEANVAKSKKALVQSLWKKPLEEVFEVKQVRSTGFVSHLDRK